MRDKGSSEHHISNNLKVIIDYVRHLGLTDLYDINRKDQIYNFLNIKIKGTSVDPDKKWITTWNHFLNRVKLFFRWL